MLARLTLCCAVYIAAGGEGISRPTTAPSSDERRSRLSLGAVAPSPVLLPELLGGVHQAMSSPTGPSGAASQRLPGQQQHLEQREAVEAAGDEVADVSLAGSFRRTREPQTRFCYLNPSVYYEFALLVRRCTRRVAVWLHDAWYSMRNAMLVARLQIPKRS